MTSPSESQPRTLAFVSSNDEWGGSEELWCQTAAALAQRGHRISIYKPRIDWRESPLRELVELGCTVADIRTPHWIPRKLRTLIAMIWPAQRRMTQICLWIGFRIRRPDLAVISQGLNYDGWLAARVCRLCGIPYVMLSQKAADMYWPNDGMLDELRGHYENAREALFVSDHNWRLTEKQLGCELRNARVIRNPVLVDWHRQCDWPDETNGTRLACPARLDTREKGQDLLLRVLARRKWRDRPISVRFFGSGHNREGLEGMARLLKLDNVSFAGFTTRPGAIWDDHHGLILASHCEGLPLSLVEAMLSARPSIVTDVGGNKEVITDGETGFLAAAATETHIDEAMERAWARRSDWRAIGHAAAQHIRTLVPPDPAARFADELLHLADTPEPRD